MLSIQIEKKSPHHKRSELLLRKIIVTRANSWPTNSRLKQEQDAQELDEAAEEQEDRDQRRPVRVLMLDHLRRQRPSAPIGELIFLVGLEQK